MALASPEEIDTVIIGNGPSALILSYILHGNIPYYSGGHNDPVLNRKLSVQPNLLDVTPDVYSHIHSSLNYSSQALPVNALLDTLLRPQGDTNPGVASCIEWRLEPDKSIPHIVLGNAPRSGGQWADNPVAASWDIGTLSYAEQLTLPGYSIGKHWRVVKNQKLTALVRPTRRDVAEYLAAYPAAVGIQEAFRTSTTVNNVTRIRNGFQIIPQNIRCKHLVLATGIFNINLRPPSFLSRLALAAADDAPLLVIGSGFTAADIIISTPPTRKIIHIFNWDPNNRPSPLKACHATAYPDYAWIYKQMRTAGDRMLGRLTSTNLGSDKPPDDATPSIKQRDWKATYEGYGNARVIASSFDVDFDAEKAHNVGRRKSHVPIDTKKALTVEIGRSSIGDSIRRTVGSFRYAVGRRGSLSYLSMPLFQEVVPESPFARRGSSISHDSHSIISDADRPRTSDGSPRSASVTHTPRLGLLEPDLRRASLSIDPKRSLLGTGRPGSSTAESLGVPEPSSHRASLSLADPIKNLRRGSAEFDFAFEPKPNLMISGQTLRSKIEAGQDEVQTGYEHHVIGAAQTQGFEVAHGVFAIGSLSGDSLIRFAFGGCAVVAGKLMRDNGILAEVSQQVSNNIEPISSTQQETGLNIPVHNTQPPGILVDGHPPPPAVRTSAEKPRFTTPIFDSFVTTPTPAATDSQQPFFANTQSSTTFTTNGLQKPQMFSENFSLANALNQTDANNATTRRNPSVDIDPMHGDEMQPHLRGQDQAIEEAAFTAAVTGKGTWMSERRKSASELPVKPKEVEQNVNANGRKGSIFSFGKVKDKMAGRR